MKRRKAPSARTASSRAFSRNTQRELTRIIKNAPVIIDTGEKETARLRAEIAKERSTLRKRRV